MARAAPRISHDRPQVVARRLGERLPRLSSSTGSIESLRPMSHSCNESVSGVRVR
jgi:hypothetical protein